MQRFFAVLIAAATLAGAAQAETVGYFKFDNISGSSFTDDTGNGLLGTLGIPAGAGMPDIVPGPSGADGDLAIEIPTAEGMVVDDSALMVLDILSPMTLQCWVKSDGFNITAEGVGIISYGGGGGGYELGVNSAGNIRYLLRGAAEFDSGVPFPFDGEWHHLAAVNDFDAGQLTIYLDGEAVFTESGIPDNTLGSTKALFVGRIGVTPNWIAFEGALDRVRVSQEAVAADDLDTDPASPAPVSEDTIAYFDFDEGTTPFESKDTPDPLTMVTLTDFSSGNAGAPEVTADTPSGADGDFSLYFSDGAQTLVRDPNRVLDVGGPGNDWTLEAWVKYPDGNFTGRMMIFYYGPGGISFSLAGTNPRLVFVTTLRIADFSSQNAAVTPDEWHHVAAVHRDGVSISFYVDGEFIEELPYTGSSNKTEVGQMTIGSEPNGVLPFTGWIDRIRISNVALEEGEFDSDPGQPASVGEWSLY